MKTFKQRLSDLSNSLTDDNIKEICDSSINSTLSDNDASLITLTLEKLSLYGDIEKVASFIYAENKLEFLKDLGMKDVFESVLSNKRIMENNPLLTSKLLPLKNSLEAKQAPLSAIIESFLAYIKPFDFLPDIDTQIKKLNETVKDYEDDIVVMSVKENLEKSSNRYLYNDIIEKMEGFIYNRSVSINEILGLIKNYQFEPILARLNEWFQKKDGSNPIGLLNENKDFKVDLIFSFLHIMEDNSFTFYHDGIFYNLYNKSLFELNEERIKELPDTFIEISKYIQKPNVTITPEYLNIRLNENNIKILLNDDGSKSMFLNDTEIKNVDPRLFLQQTGLFGITESVDLAVINKIWEHINTLINLDFGRKITSRVYDGLGVSLFKLDENYYVHKVNLPMRINEILKGNGIQVKNEIFNFMKYDIGEKLYEFLEGDSKRIAELRVSQEEIQSAIFELRNSLEKIEKTKEYGILTEAQVEDSNIIDNITSNMEALKEKYNEIQSEINRLEYIVSEDENSLKAVSTENETGKININDQVRVKSTGMVAKVININSVTGTVGLLTNERETIYLPKSEVECIKDNLEQQLQHSKDVADGAMDKLKGMNGGKVSENFFSNIKRKITGKEIEDLTPAEKELFIESFKRLGFDVDEDGPEEVFLHKKSDNVGLLLNKTANTRLNRMVYHITVYDENEYEYEYLSDPFPAFKDENIGALKELIKKCSVILKEDMKSFDMTSLSGEKGGTIKPRKNVFLNTNSLADKIGKKEGDISKIIENAKSFIERKSNKPGYGNRTLINKNIKYTSSDNKDFDKKKMV